MYSYAGPQQRFDAILAKIEERRIPFWAHIDLTYRCNLRCVHCYCQDLSRSFSSGKKDLTLGEIRMALDQLADMGSLNLSLSGGEVFLRKDFFDIAAYARKKHFALKIFTNGTLIDDEVARRLARLAPLQVEMSVYGVTADVHDAITRREGSHKKVVQSVALLKSHGLRVELKSVVMKQNFHQSGAIEAFARGIGADEFRMTSEISPKNDGSKSTQIHQIDDGQLHEVVSRENSPEDVVKDEYWDKPLEKPICGTGSTGCYISPCGEVYPCALLLVPMGNIKEKELYEIWHAQSPLRGELDGLKKYADLPSCRSCEYVRFCRICIGAAYLETGDLKGCYHTQKMYAKAVCETRGHTGLPDVCLRERG